MARAVIFKRNRGTIDVQCLFVGKNFTWNRACGGRRKSKVPPFYSRRCREMFPGIFVGQNVRAVLTHPFIASQWSKCQCVLTRCLIGSGLRFARASVIFAREVA